ncbi:MAG: tetratricopeptide repeat protein [Nitrosomonadales bacterium]|nr:tetratricopeptide repeat protein [Nitrosomonadales bacterium]
MKKSWLIAAGGLVVVIAVVLYFVGKKPGGTAPQDAANAQMAPEHLEMIKSLATRLEQNPTDGKGWAMLARAYAVLGRYNEALPAYEKAANLIQNDPVLLVDYADVLAAANGRNLQGKPLELVQRALMIDPGNVKGLNLMGSAAFQAGDYTHAIGYWDRLLKMLPPDSPNAKQVSANIANAHARESGQPQSSTAPAPSAAGSAQISGMVSLSPALAAKASPTDTVFVYAKAVSGPPAPLAVIRAQVKDLPQRFVLNDAMAMMPNAKISNFKEVVVSAKVSKSGNATPQSGDLRGEVASVKVGADNVQLVIDKVVP